MNFVAGTLHICADPGMQAAWRLLDVRKGRKQRHIDGEAFPRNLHISDQKSVFVSKEIRSIQW